jgi:4-carboxymuconolactone decarboxylase
MNHFKAALLALAALAGASPALAQDTAPETAHENSRRFKLIPFTEMTPEQKKYADAVLDGPTSKTGSAAAVPGAPTIGAPFNVYLRSPLLAEQLRLVAEYIRFKTTIPTKLNEFAILVTARQWGSQYEWFAHHRLAIKAGLKPEIAADLAQGKRPAGMSPEEGAIYDFSQELHTTHAVSDATYKAVVDRFGEQGAVDLIAVNGYYVLVSMILNVDRTPMPGGAKPPLAPLK